jgi:ganglioside-induced differentiation-associated protein 1
MTLVLYHYGNSVCAEKARLALDEKGVKWESREVDLFDGSQFDPEYLKINPKAVVPTLIHDGRVLPESSIICEYIDDIFPEPRLKPSDPFDVAQMRMYPKAVDEGLHWGVGIFSFVAMFADRLRKLSVEEREARFARMPDLDRRERQSTIVERGVDAPHVLRAIAIWEAGLDKVEKALADGRPWIMGENYTLADLSLTPYVSRLEYINYFPDFTQSRLLTRSWWSRVKARPSFKSANAAWISEAEIAEMAEGGNRTRAAVADKRKNYLATDSVASQSK